MLAKIPDFNLALTANSGQSFRFHQQGKGVFSLTACGRHVFIEQLPSETCRFSCNAEEFASVWHPYLDLDRDYSALGALIGANDTFLARAYQYARGIRILRQEPFEALICFIVSQRKSIPAIRSCVEALARRYGKPICPDAFAFPEPAALAAANAAELAACGLGYRVPYVLETARMVDGGVVSLEALRHLDDAALEAALQRFPGVGRKVAACVMLFAYQRMEAFPVDVWIERVLREHYPEGFPAYRFKGMAGILQQYLFCYARHLAGRD
ncbi:MAG TPA: DNA glycosylase [Clostridia bacterium]|jgi:N-glycosylase/DNA lyase|nr:DNA glycosylase [Clostridia bacterium]HQA98350.1 DNA glycosylase [Clostridia bacterium]HQO55495.1 DNA glycosylase [Clostridia bacterium]HUM60316.1 DNA glycosylase [Clostridia bacterium]